uniref:Kynureninase n=1 Tax=Colletotrichum fructicola (strain Nara gc5) TaxID=1213859 RepID=L2FW04_COLFN
MGDTGRPGPFHDSPLPTWLDVDAKASKMMAPIVGADPSEVAVMQTLTANLHLLMSAFYKPQKDGRHKIILESKAFPSDHFVVETQIRHHGLSPETSMVCIEPKDAAKDSTLSTEHILSYLNGGPGCIGGAFVHERHSRVTTAVSDPDAASGYTNRFAGWWGNDKSSRFVMATKFHPAPGAAGFQLSNPSVLDITSLCASLEVFELAGGVVPLREKSLRLTAYLEGLLDGLPEDVQALIRIITPREPEARGAQLSLMLADGLLDGVMEYFEEEGVIIDERKPNVVRVAPAPLYNNFVDCFDFVEQFAKALRKANKSP